jgi:hypothetical protein
MPRNRARVSATALIAVVALLAACSRESNRWQPAPEGAAPAPAAGDQRIVLFAPVAVGPLAAVHPDARIDFAYDMAQRMDLLLRDHDGRVGENLPDSDHPAWRTRVAATAGAHLVVLTEISEVERIAGSPGATGRPGTVRAVVRMRALDVDGREVWAKKTSGGAEILQSPKLLSPSARPESLAAWDGCLTAEKALFTWLETRPDLVATPHRASQDAQGPLVAVTIDSRPPNADIIVDGELRGTTPRTLKLPPRPLTIRLERQGHQPWQRSVTPSEGLELAPALEPLPKP